MVLKKFHFQMQNIWQAKIKVASVTFYFRDPFLRLFLHHLLLELDLCDLGHLLSLCQKHQFGQQDHECTNARTSFADWLQWSNDQVYQWWPSSFQSLLPFPRSSGSELWSTDESSLLPCMQDKTFQTHILFPEVSPYLSVVNTRKYIFPLTWVQSSSW